MSNSLQPAFPKESYSWGVIAILLVVYTFAYMDRQILNLLVDPIKAELQITDTQISYLSGLAFAVFYTFFGIPLGRLADSSNREAGAYPQGSCHLRCRQHSFPGVHVSELGHGLVACHRAPAVRH